jgi:hypothetical protein
LSGFQSSGSDAEENYHIGSCHKDFCPEKAKSEEFPFKPEGKAVNDETNGNEKDGIRRFGTIIDYSPQLSSNMCQPGARFPSTQILVDAATANPWGSALKKTKQGKSDKRVSFGTLPSEDVEKSTTGSSSRPPARMGSPPPPPGTQRLTQLDDPFHHKLKATRNLEVTEESLTRFMKTPWDDMPKSIKLRAKPPPNSPAVDAMAEAFIAADEHTVHKKCDNNDSSDPAGRLLTRMDNTENLIQPRIWKPSEYRKLKSSSPPDASFSIAPCGKVTAVNIASPSFNAEENLHAVLEDMGSFLEGWDVDSELKKAKGQKPEKSSGINGQRKRAYLLGVSNR